MNSIKVRVQAWKYFLIGDITFFQALIIMMPNFMRPNKIDKTFLFGKPFVGNLAEVIGLRTQIIKSNQYHQELIKEKDIVVDAGANWGIFSVFVAVKHPDATIYAFEPTPSTFSALKENTKYYPNIKIFSYGLGEKEKSASIVLKPDSGGNYIGEGGIPIEIKSIDSLNIPMNFLKMDVEGYEANILKGATEVIKREKPIIVMSAYHKPNDKTYLPELLNGITPYDCELRHDSEEDFICKPKAS